MHFSPIQTFSSTYRITLVRHDPAVSVTRLLYLLDGDAALAAIEPPWLARHPGLALVAIGYPDTERFNLDRRSRDYTPPPPPGWDGGSRKALDRPHGGAAAFLDILNNQIDPAVTSALGTSLPRELWGHSYGGLFALWMLTQAGHGFDRVHAASPSLWWGGYVLEHHLLIADLPQPAPRQLSLSMGDSEISRTGERLFTPERLEAVALTLRRQISDCAVTIFDQTGHGPAFERSLQQAISAR